jgi:hypothetical protein
MMDRYPNRLESNKQDLKASSISDLEISDNFQDCEIVLCFDLIPNENYFRNNQTAKFYLIRTEPPIVLPDLYKKSNILKFTKIISVGSAPSRYKNTIFWPQTLLHKTFENEVRFDNQPILINSDLLSLKVGEMYSFRRKVLIKIPITVLYGRGWNKTLPERSKVVLLEFLKFIKMPGKIKFSGLCYYFRRMNNYGGELSDKTEALKNYKYSIVIENSLNYMSEKLFDSLASGCIPIYIGPSLANYQIPTGLVIESEPSIESIKNSLIKADSINYEAWKKSAGEWLSSADTVKLWDKSTFFSRLINLLN